MKKLIEKSWRDLGKMSQEEILVSIAFGILVLLWFFRDPGFEKPTHFFVYFSFLFLGFIPGWVVIFPEPRYISDGVPVKLKF